MVLSSLIEFGFAINEYLDLIDTTRETARWLSDQDPFLPGTTDMDEDFYLGGVDEMTRTLARAGWINLDTSTDDLIISVFAVTDTDVTNRYPASFTDDRGSCNLQSNGGENGWRLYCKKPSDFTSGEVTTRMDSISSAPDTGIAWLKFFLITT
jgi:hypothetical protein